MSASIRRPDIQVLRGLAIAAVVGYHVGALPGGYLGVDLFFALSGYLLTRLVTSPGAASIPVFYARRVLRLVPSLVVVLALSTIAARHLLTQAELESFHAQLIGAALFISNVVLWQQGGYFDVDSAFKPLLHTWSLGIEAQMILLLPLLGLARASLRLPLVIGVSIASAMLCVLLWDSDPDAAFFLMTARAWEFGIGAAGALVQRRASATAAAFALAAVLGTMAWAPGFDHPGIGALIVCIGTVVVLSAHAQFLQRVVTRPIVWLGDISYALYLVHWPLLAFTSILYLGSPLSLKQRCMLIIASIFMGWALHAGIARLVPLMRRVPRAWVAGLCGGALLLSPMLARATGVDWAEERRANHGLGPLCEYDGKFEPRSACVKGSAPRVLVWGDSIAMQWIYGLAQTRTDNEPGLVQATMSTCGPLLGVSPLYTGRLGEAWARRCISFNDAVMAWLRNESSISHVVLSARFLSYVEPGQRLLTRSGKASQSVDAARVALQSTVEAIRAAGKRVVIIAAIPEADYDVGACLERKQRGLPVAGRRDCSVDAQQYRDTHRSVFELLDGIAKDSTPVLRSDALLCAGAHCASTLDGQPLYRDRAHLSRRGSVMVTRKLELWRQILETKG